jgi:hypothetical protein
LSEKQLFLHFDLNSLNDITTDIFEIMKYLTMSFTVQQKINSALPQFPPLQNGGTSGSSSFGFAPGTGQIPQPTLTDTFGLPAAASSFQQNQFTPQEQQQSAWQQQQAALAAFLAGPTNTSSTKQPSGPRSSIAGIPDIIPNLPKPPSADTFQRTPVRLKRHL